MGEKVQKDNFENRRRQVEELESFECADLVNSPTFILLAYKAEKNM